MLGRPPTKNGAVTGLQTNAELRRPLRVPTVEELPPLVERSTLGIIDEAFTFLRIAPGLLFGVAVVVLLPLRLMAAAMPGSALRDSRPDQLLDLLIGNLGQPGAVLAAIISLVLESVALLTVGSLYGQLAASWYSGRSLSATDLLLAAIKRSPIILAIWIVTRLVVVIGGLFTSGLLAIVAGVGLAVVGPVLGAEKAGGREAVKRSLALTTGRFMKVVLVFISTGLTGLIMRLMIRTGPPIITSQFQLPLWLSSSIFDFLGTVVSLAFTAAASVILYLDLRIRREGIDLDMAAGRSLPIVGRPANG